MNLLDLTVERAKDAYRKTGLRPTSRLRAVKDGACCMIGALMVEAGRPYLGPRAEAEGSGGDPALATLGIFVAGWVYSFESGFDAGFEDGFEDGASDRPGDAHFEHGREVGSALRGWTPEA